MSIVAPAAPAPDDAASSSRVAQKQHDRIGSPGCCCVSPDCEAEGASATSGLDRAMVEELRRGERRLLRDKPSASAERSSASARSDESPSVPYNATDTRLGTRSFIVIHVHPFIHEFL